MYGRQYDGRTLIFEASGGLLNGAMVIRDKQTDSYWSLMTGDAIAGELKGTRLDEWPLGEKVQWKDWVARHPDTLVLSVNGREHVDADPHASYYESASGFRGIVAWDRRMVTKAPIYAFRLGEEKYAVPFSAFEEGALFKAGGRGLFLYRPPGAAVFHSSLAFQGAEGDFSHDAGGWLHRPSGAIFDPEAGGFMSASGSRVSVEKLVGFDTFWYVWSLTHPDTHVLEPASR